MTTLAFILLGGLAFGQRGELALPRAETLGDHLSKNPLRDNLPGVSATSTVIVVTNPGLPATPGQFASVATTAAGGLSSNVAGNLRLASSVGAGFSLGLPDLLFADRILPPDTDVNENPLAGSPFNYWRAEPVRPGERVVVRHGQPARELVPAGTLETYYYSPHAEQVHASAEGLATIVWRTLLPLVEGEQAFGVVTQTYQVASASRFPENDRTIFWTEDGFTGPNVVIPNLVQDLVIAHNPQIPENVPAGEGFTNGANQVETRTLWQDEFGGVLKAANRQGRVLIEYLGASRGTVGEETIRESLGIEVVNVIQEAFPAEVTTWLGEQLLPSGNTLADPLACPCFEDQLGLVPHQVRNNDPGATRYVEEHFLEDESVFYAVRENPEPNQVQFYWLERGSVVRQMLWPKQLDHYELVWPAADDFDAQFARPVDAGNSSNSFVALPRPNSPELVYHSPGASLDHQSNLHIDLGGGASNHSLVRFRAGNDFWYMRIRSAREQSYLQANPTALVGERIPNPPGTDSVAGYIDPAYGDAYNAGAYIDPFGNGGLAAAERGAVIPVNALPGNDRMRVWWFQRIDPPAAVAGSFQPVWAPSTVHEYTLAYPDPGDVRQIVLASNQGSGELPAAEAVGSIYVQNDPDQTGYNPNEEHALMAAGRAWALRDDLNLPESSQPFVLVDYTDPGDDRPGMAVFHVVRETVDFPFRYDAVAGTILQAPMPLPILPRPLIELPNGDQQSRNEEVGGIDPPANTNVLARQAHYERFTFEDRKGATWIYRGPHEPGVSPTFAMRYYYTTQASFAFPRPGSGANEAPALGSIVPYLRPPDGAGGWVGSRTGLEESLDITFVPTWPEVVPELRFAETLGLPKFGLPQIRGQRSVQVIYENSLTPQTNATNSVVLHDPTRAKTFSFDAVDTDPKLDRIPDSIATAMSSQKIFFQNLPTHLQDRLYFDPLAGANGQLVLEGAYQEEIVGESYFLLNVLDAEEVAVAKGLCATNDNRKAKWDAAIDGLATTVERFIENPNVAGTYIVDPNGDHQTFGVDEIVQLTSPPSRPPASTNAAGLGFYDEAVDSYALTAVGGGEGYVSIIVGNGAAFTPGEEPVSVHIIRVGGGLYRGQLKPVLSSNPLSENVTVQHTGDFAADTPSFEFEWRSAPPVDGLAPQVYGLQAENVALPASFDISTNGIAAGTETIPFQTNTPRVVNTRGGDGHIDLSATIVSPSSNIATLGAFYVGLTHAPEDTIRFSVNGIPAFTTGADIPIPLTDLPVGVRPAMNGVTAVHAVPLRLLSFDGSEDIDLRITSISDPGSPTGIDLRLAKMVRIDRTDTTYLPIGNGQPVPGKNRHLVAGAGIDTLGDKYYIMRYRPLAGHVLHPGDWSEWTEPALVEGWIKRVLAGINPFNQRISDFFENAVDTDVSLLTQAGTRYEGDIALNLDAVQEAGLIEIYETVLKRGVTLSIGGTPEIDYAPANDALLLAAGYLADLYMALGNEAYADAANPGILYDSQAIGTIAGEAVAVDFDSVFRSTATARFAFEGQVASLLEEELHLLRGRDDLLAPGIERNPVYNKLFWNYTRGIDAGEVIYALNYNITEKDDDSADGKIDAADAARQYPQGHGDAYGHYLTVLSYYYRLLTDDHFTWGTRSEAVNILGVPVSVDYLDERKFAAAAAALGRTTTQIQTLEHRKAFQSAPAAGWEHLTGNRESREPIKRTHAWSFDDWSHRGGQGTFYHWVTANAILPEIDNVHEGIQKIDRTTVPELDELARSGEAIQLRMDSANAGLNPLDLTDDSVVFDISPREVEDGVTHFEQVYNRALQALRNAEEVYERATESSRLLRAIENQNQNLNASIVDQERAFLLQLWDIYGSPYQGDIGPGKIYAQGYGGPDIHRYMFIDRPFDIFARESLFKFDDGTRTYNLLVSSPELQRRIDSPANFHGIFDEASNTNHVKQFTWRRDMGPYQFATPEMGARPYLGTLQHTAADLRLAEEELMNALNGMEFKRTLFLAKLNRWERDMANRAAKLTANQAFNTAESVYREVLAATKALAEATEKTKQDVESIAASIIANFPDVSGLSNDVTAPAEAAILFQAYAANQAISSTDFAAKRAEAIADIVFYVAGQTLEKLNLSLDEEKHWRAQVADLNAAYREARGAWRDVDAKQIAYIRALEAFRVEENNGDTVRGQREVYRKRAAAIVQGYRTRDVAFRSFRTESLEQYQTLLDWAAKYTFLAAKAYDYETGLLSSAQGRAFLGDIVASRSLGILDETGQPTFAASQHGDPGLAGLLARLKSDWDVVEGRLGFNNPDDYGTTFSLREEHFRIPRGEAGDRLWKEKLASLIQPNLLTDADVAAYALQVDQTDGTPAPGFVVSFPSTIKTGLNFFGKPLAAGDHRYTESNFANKIAAAGVVFDGYKGMDPCLVCLTPGGVGPDTSDHPDALAATPHVYLMPVGADTMRPPLGTGGNRNWRVLDHALPMPFDIGSFDDGSAAPAPGATSLDGAFRAARKHQAFRAVGREEFFLGNRSHEYTNSRLIGRSAENTEWKLVIPAAELLNDPEEGMKRFINSVEDIKLHLRTYSYSGN